MANYMKNVAEMLGVELNEEFIVIHGDGRSTVKLTSEGLKFVNHLGQLKPDASSICLKEILNGSFKIEHIIKRNNEDCKYLKTEDVTPWHGDVFDHPDYEYTCKKVGRKVIPFIHCKRCKEYIEE